MNKKLFSFAQWSTREKLKQEYKKKISEWMKETAHQINKQVYPPYPFKFVIIN